MAAAGAVYSRLFGRAANDRARRLAVRDGVRFRALGGRCRHGAAAGERRRAPAGTAAIGVFLSLVVLGAGLWVRPIRSFTGRCTRFESASRREDVGPSAAASPESNASRPR